MAEKKIYAIVKELDLNLIKVLMSTDDLQIAKNHVENYRRIFNDNFYIISRVEDK